MSRRIDTEPSIRRGTTRGRQDAGWLQAHFSFSFGQWRDPGRDGFSALIALNEDRISPGAGFPMHPHRDLEILMLPLAGAIAHADSLGNAFVAGTDAVVHMRAGRGMLHSQLNASDYDIDHHLQVWLRPRTRGLEPHASYRTFRPEDRQDRWQLVASCDGAAGSLRIDVAAWVWRARVRGRTLLYRPAAGRSVYLHVAQGQIAVDLGAGGGHALAGGDAVAWQRSQAVHLIPGETAAEVLLFDLPPVC